MNTKYLLFPFFSAVGVAAALSFISCASGNSVPPAVEASRSEFAPIAADVTPDAVFEIRIVDADHQVRVVNKPTLAALDFAAYSSNPIRLAGKDEVPENYKGTMGNALFIFATMLFRRLTAKLVWLRPFALLIAFAVLALFLPSCSDLYTDSVGNLLPDEFSSVGFGKDSLDRNMVRIYASGAHVTLGTDDSTVKLNERTKMRVDFDYDFSIGKHEVTCGEFNKFAGTKKSALKNHLSCKSANMPASEITYFDAVLFANAKSVSMGLDSAYTYMKVIYDDDGSCINLEGLVFMSETDGYRLPNEAEWLLAASQGWEPSESWNASNSKYRAHEVCGKKKNELGLCDMAGNVVEWTNDWMGLLRDTTVVLDDFLVEPDVLQSLEFVMVRAQNVGEIPDFSAACGGDDE